MPTQAASRKSPLRLVRNHREAIAAYDFFTVPTVTFKLLYIRNRA